MFTTILAAITIVLPMEAEVRGSEIELGEVATIQGATAEELALLEDLELGRTPTPGYSRVLTPADVQAHVRRVLPGAEVTYAGRRACRIELATHAITPPMISAAVHAELAAVVGARDITWEPLDKLATLEVPLGQGGAEPRLEVVLGAPRLTTGPLPVEVRLLVDDELYRSVRARWDVTVWETLPVLTRNLPAGSRVLPTHFELERVALPAEGRGAVLMPAAMDGVVARRSLVAGSVVLDGDVDRPSVVHEGEQLTLLVKKGSIEARVQVIATATAAVGDRIRVRRLSGGVELHAIVRSKELCEVVLDS